MEASSSLIFISGGVRSGKSSFAEKLAINTACNTGGMLHYIATGVSSDLEMKQRIKKHQQDRTTGKYPWKTIEKPVQIGDLAPQFDSEDIILLDCVTTLLNNELFFAEEYWTPSFLQSVMDRVISGIMAISNRVGSMIVVSNEVLFEPNLKNELVFSYGRMLGKIHQQLVKNADKAFLIEAGIPLVMKGAGK